MGSAWLLKLFTARNIKGLHNVRRYLLFVLQISKCDNQCHHAVIIDSSGIATSVMLLKLHIDVYIFNKNSRPDLFVGRVGTLCQIYCTYLLLRTLLRRTIWHNNIHSYQTTIAVAEVASPVTTTQSSCHYSCCYSSCLPPVWLLMHVLWNAPLYSSNPMIANMTIMNKTSSEICSNGAMAWSMDLSTTCKPTIITTTTVS